ncbi:MAG TPA: sigma-70 family RNA polymerase sigma factor [Planctomycetota bacterium]|nr:sigma-70 family RNA polymerase sigma factor [Planctomycetota bacterium]
MTAEAEETVRLLGQWHAGDSEALAKLVALHLPWLHAQIEARLGAFLRAQGDPMDYLNDTMLAFLRDAPKFQVRDGTHLRSLLIRIAEHALRDKNDWFRRKRRDLARRVAVPNDSVLDLDSGLHVSSTPSRHAARNETREWIRLALELLDGADRKILVEREYEQRSFEQIGAGLNLSANAARMRWTRALARLTQAMQALRAGRMPEPQRDPASPPE